MFASAPMVFEQWIPQWPTPIPHHNSRHSHSFRWKGDDDNGDGREWSTTTTSSYLDDGASGDGGASLFDENADQFLDSDGLELMHFIEAYQASHPNHRPTIELKHFTKKELAYYMDYDVTVGYHIALSLGVLVLMFIVFVLYKAHVQTRKNNELLQQQAYQREQHNQYRECEQQRQRETPRRMVPKMTRQTTIAETSFVDTYVHHHPRGNPGTSQSSSYSIKPSTSKAAKSVSIEINA